MKLGVEDALSQSSFNFFLPQDRSFRRGMDDEKTSRRLGDPLKDKWEINYQFAIDFMILISHDDESVLKQRYKDLEKISSSIFGNFKFLEKGYRKENHKNQPIEHFGYRDGLSKLKLWNKHDKFVSRAKLSVLLDETWGSYLVFRKYEQHVDTYHNRIEELAEKISTSMKNPPKKNSNYWTDLIEYCKAQVIGRYPDGTPLFLFDKPESWEDLKKSKKGIVNEEKIRQFNQYPIGAWKHPGYTEETNGAKCPFHSHIRKTNPRNSKLSKKISYGGNEIESELRIARRGIPYGKDNTGEELGLLFMCFQGSIAKQFELILRNWCNTTGFFETNTGTDPIIGTPKKNVPQRWNKKWNSKKNTVNFNFNAKGRAPIVTMKGGYYLYAPSIQWFKSLK